jgi:hypothetical protein
VPARHRLHRTLAPPKELEQALTPIIHSISRLLLLAKISELKSLKSKVEMKILV